MTALLFDDPRLVEFILAASNGVAKRLGENEIRVEDAIDFALLQRFSEGQTTAIRYAVPDGPDFWLITGFAEGEIVRTATRLHRFLAPTYGIMTPNAEDLQRFASTSSKLRPLANSLGLPGFFRLKTIAHQRSAVLHALGAWMKLEADRPIIQRVDRPTYRGLFMAFQSALATSSWESAKETLDQISRYRLTTADNVAFLEIRLLAAQERWKEIWESARYPEWARQRIPRQIRAALITAYHHSVLSPIELNGNWTQALLTFQQTRHRLGRLLETRLQEDSLPVVRVFAYLAVDAADHQLAQGLQTALAPDILAGISPILDSMPAVEPDDAPALSAEHEIVRLLYAESNLDSAREAIVQLTSPVMQAQFLVDLSDRTRDVADVEKALNAIEHLQVWDRNDLFQAKPYLQRRVETLKSLVGRSESSQEPIDSWKIWLERAQQAPSSPDIEKALDFLLQQNDERMWEPAEARMISNAVQSIVLDSKLVSREIVRQGISALADQLLLDDQFPRIGHTYIDLYESMYTFILETGQRSEPESRRLIRYAEAILMDDPARVTGISDQFQGWFSTPRPVLLDAQLDALELVCDYGKNGRSLVAHVRMWADAMLSFASNIDESTLRSWAEFATDIDAGNDIVSRLADQRAVVEGTLADVVNGLPDRFRIAIFTLRPKSADRVRSVLLEMNPRLDVQISDEKDLSPRVKNLASSADLPVVVTTCITHALTYGIGPHLKVEPVRPASSGSTSIIRAVAQALQQ